jgi:sugar lactone lactonase YvrE
MVLAAAGTLAIVAASWAAGTGSAQGPGPTAGEQLTTGLLSPRGLKVGPDGMLYVAEAGTGGDTVINVDGADHNVGDSGRISRIDPETGERTTVADGLHSDFSSATMDSIGPADVAFIGDQLYYLQTHGGDDYGAPDTPTGVYRVNDNGSTDLIADIGQFNFDNPVQDILDLPATGGAEQADVEPGGNPYAMIVRNGAFLVTDGNQNQVMEVTTDGDVSRIAELSGHPVSTGIASQSSGPLYVGALGTFPFNAEDGLVYQVGYPSGSTSVYASGFSSVTDVEYGPGGLYAVTFGDQAAAPDGPPWDPFTGKILRVNTDGSMTPIVDGLTFSTFVAFAGDTAYVSNNSLSIPDVFEGEIVKIENFSTITLPAPQPTAVPTTAPPPPAATPTAATGGIVAPDTGMGGGSESAGLPAIWLAIGALAAGAVACGGFAYVRVRR